MDIVLRLESDSNEAPVTSLGFPGQATALLGHLAPLRMDITQHPVLGQR